MGAGADDDESRVPGSMAWMDMAKAIIIMNSSMVRKLGHFLKSAECLLVVWMGVNLMVVWYDKG